MSNPEHRLKYAHGSHIVPNYTRAQKEQQSQMTKDCFLEEVDFEGNSRCDQGKRKKVQTDVAASEGEKNHTREPMGKLLSATSHPASLLLEQEGETEHRASP
jgi:hypothetical protein